MNPTVSVLAFALLASAAFGQHLKAPGNDLVSPDAKPELIQGGFKFTEGPTLAMDGRVFFTDIPNNRIHVYDPATGAVTLHRENSGGANGLKFTAGGALLACEGANRLLTQQVGESVTPVASDFEGKKFQGPNDLDLDKQGGIYFTDPYYGPKKAPAKPGEAEEVEKEAVYYIAPTTGKITRVINTLAKPNGIALSLDYKTLYVGDNGADNVQAFDVNPSDGTVSNQRIFAPSAPMCDGLTIDEKGNLYVTVKAGVNIYSPSGEDLGTVVLPEVPRNCTFGATGTKTLYITAYTGLYKLKMTVDGRK